MNKSSGFTIVELIITIIVGMLLLTSIYQFYNYILTDSAESRTRAIASNLAYRYLREAAGSIPATCTSTASVTDVATHPAGTDLPPPASAPAIRTTTKCATNSPSSVSIVTVEVRYGDPVTTISHATYAENK